jgi:alpha-beta hydrolase superfamily lysophospholipase
MHLAIPILPLNRSVSELLKCDFPRGDKRTPLVRAITLLCLINAAVLVKDGGADSWKDLVIYLSKEDTMDLKRILVSLVVCMLILVTGCSQTGPTPGSSPHTSVPSAASSTPSEIPPPTSTDVPPTATETLTPTSAFTNTPEVIEEIELKTKDGVPLAGWLYHSTASSEHPVAVVLAHQMNSSSWEWRNYAELFAQNGFTTLIFDFRGQGHSYGFLDFNSVGVDVETAIKYLNANGYDQIVCMGASMGGSGCLAASINYELVGLVNLSGPMNIPGTRLVTDEDLTAMTFPKLFMIAEEDTIPDWPTYFSEFVDMAALSPEPKELITYPGQAHGVGLLRDAESGQEAVERLLDFLNAVLPQD